MNTLLKSRIFGGSIALFWGVFFLNPVSSSEINNSVVQIQNQAEPGTGFFVKHGGKLLLITAKHVLGTSGDAVTITVPGSGNIITFPLKDQLPIGNIDAAVIIIKPGDANIQTLEIGSSPIVENEQLTLWGFPITGKSVKVPLSSRKGRYLGIPKEIQDGYSIRYDASTQIGFSGGPIVNSAGHVIGMHGRAESSSSSSGMPKRTGNALGIPIGLILTAISVKNHSDKQLDEKELLRQGARASMKRIYEMMTNASLSDQILTELTRAEASNMPIYCIEMVKAYYYTFFSSVPDLQRANSSLSIIKKVNGVDPAYYALGALVSRKIADYKKTLDYSRILELSGNSDYLQFSERRLSDEIHAAVAKCSI